MIDRLGGQLDAGFRDSLVAKPFINKRLYGPLTRGPRGVQRLQEFLALLHFEFGHHHLIDLRNRRIKTLRRNRGRCQ